MTQTGQGGTQRVCAVCAVTSETIDASLRFASLQATCSAPVLSLEARAAARDHDAGVARSAMVRRTLDS
ncbi:MAG: hypothetical protein AAFV32_08250 [Myxococcota bacterium]